MADVIKAGIKSGWKTTEFWVTIIASIAAIVGALAGVVPAKWAAIFVVISEGAYAISRGLAKK